MTRCPRCSLGVPAYTRCERCGLVLGFDGFTVLLVADSSPEFQRARKLAHLQPTCTEWKEENGTHFLHVTYTFNQVEELSRLLAAASKVARKRVFVTGLEVPWAALAENARQYADFHMLGRPERASQRVPLSH